jgi:hypothetical protein
LPEASAALNSSSVNEIPFGSPEDFRRRLSLALLRLERDSISIPGAKISRMLPRLCDRVPQLNNFSNSLNAPAVVCLYMLYGFLRLDGRVHGIGEIIAGNVIARVVPRF